jgi:DNA invertase Pin-like site-specific DNA recombinase
MTMIGYARVSTRRQDYTLQFEQLKEAGCERVFREKESGAKWERRELQRMLKSVEPGDVVHVYKLDRLARSSRDLFNIIHLINEAGGAIKSLTEAWCDTTTARGKLLITIMSGVAEFERELILSRTAAGIQRAREIGKDFGRPSKLNDRQKRLIAERHAAGETIDELKRVFNVGHATIWRALHP